MHISILVALIGTLTVLCMQNVYAIPSMSPQDLYKQSDMVFYGTVISKSAGPGPDYNYYQVKVDTYFKNPQNSDSITVAGRKSDDSKVSHPQFNVGDTAIFYINKLGGINTLSLYSQKADSACSVASFVRSNTVSNDSSIMRGAPVHEIRILDSAGNVVNIAKTNQPLVITSYDFSNVIPQERNVTAILVIQKYSDTQPVFYQEQNVSMIACSYSPKPSWNFTPLASGHYNVTLTFDDVKIETDFYVRDNLSSKSIDKAPNELSPLKQFESGVTTQNIVCKDGFVLTIKKQGHQPACVDPDTVSKLVLRGWSENPLNELLLKYGNQTQANLVFNDIMNESKIRDWSMIGWRYSDYSYASNGETHQSSATIHLYLPSDIGKHECENGSYGIVVINLNPVEVEHNYTDVGCNIITITSVDPESNVK